MGTIGVLVDTNIVSRLLASSSQESSGSKPQADREYLQKILEEYVEAGIVQLYVNPTIESEIQATSDAKTKERLLEEFYRFRFTPFNKTVFPFKFPATFITEEESMAMETIVRDIPGFEKDRKVLADAAFNPEMAFLVTADEKHLANDRLRGCLNREGLDKTISVFTPKELYEHLKEVWRV